MKRYIVPAVPLDEIVDRIAYRFSLQGDNIQERKLIMNELVPKWLHRNLHADPDGVMVHIYTDDGYDFGTHHKKFWWEPSFQSACDMLGLRWYNRNKIKIKQIVGPIKKAPDIYDYAFELADWCLDNNGEFDSDHIARQTLKRFKVPESDVETYDKIIEFLESL